MGGKQSQANSSVVELGELQVLEEARKRRPWLAFLASRNQQELAMLRRAFRFVLSDSSSLCSSVLRILKILILKISETR